MRFLIVLAVLAAQQLGDAQPLNEPDAAAIARVYPDAARRDHVSGDVSLGCEVLASGRLGDCEVLAEAPSGYGFAEAALALRAAYLYAPATVDGEPAPGRAAVLVQFRPPVGTGRPWPVILGLGLAVMAAGWVVLRRRRGARQA